MLVAGAVAGGVVEEAVSGVGVASFIHLGVKLRAELFVVFVEDGAFFGLVGLQEVADAPAIPRGLHFLLGGVVLLEGLVHLLLHALTNK